MPIQPYGFSGTTIEVEATHRAQRVTPRPLDHGALGHYRLGVGTGILPAALAANSEIFQFRWADATRICLIQSVKFSAVVSTTFFAAGVPITIDMIGSTGWTVQGTGGNGINMSSGGKARSSMANSQVAAGDIRIATAALLGAGTKTLAANPTRLIQLPGPITGSLNGQIAGPETFLYDIDISSGEYPLTLATNEGFSIRSVAVPITGTWTAGVEVRWVEVVAY